MSWAALIGDLTRWLEQRDLLVRGQRIVVGVSGGCDSTALLHALAAASTEQSLDWSLHVAHLHHGLRGDEADGDEQFVRELADSLGLPCTCERCDIRAIVAEAGGSVEEVARRVRYDFLERVALRNDCDLVAVAHHADDDAETVLHRICRGTGMRGLAGMRPVRSIQPGSRIRLVRPFLHQPRERIIAAARQQGFSWREDSTNAGSTFTRGKIRNVILPVLREQINPNVTAAVLRLAEQARWFGDYLEDAAARTYDSLVISESPTCIVLNNRGLLSKQRIVQAELVRRSVSLLTGHDADVGYGHVDDVLALAAERSSGKEVHLPGGLIVRKVYDRIEFRTRSDLVEPPAMAPVHVQCPGRTPLPALSAELLAELCEVDPSTIRRLREHPNPHEEWLDYERLQLPLIVRGRRPGDRFRPLGAPGSKTVGDFFSDEKIDPALRARTGLVCDQAGLAWVMPLRIDERVKLRPTTRRALRLVLKVKPSGQHATP